jgi:hypothetical protein
MPGWRPPQHDRRYASLQIDLGGQLRLPLHEKPVWAKRNQFHSIC